MRDYSKISCSIWNSRKFKSIADNDDARLVYFYLHTCPHVNQIGCFVLPIGYATTDLGWSEERFRKAFETLSSTNLIGWDEGESLVRIVDFIKHDPFTNPNHAVGAVKIAMQLPECDESAFLFSELMGSKHVKITDEMERLSKGFQKAFETQNQNQSQNQSQNQKKEGGGGGALTRRPSPDFLNRVFLEIGASDKLRAKLTIGADEITTSWLDEGLSEDQAVSVIAGVMAGSPQSPPKTLRYFSPAMLRAVTEATPPTRKFPRKASSNAIPSPASSARLGPILGAALSRSKPIDGAG